MIAQDLKLFLEDQHAERKMEQGNLDKSRPTVRKLYERHAVKEKNYKEIFRQRCRLTKTQHIKEAAVFYDSRLQDVEPHDRDFRTLLGGGQFRHSTDAANGSDIVKVQLLRNPLRTS